MRCTRPETSPIIDPVTSLREQGTLNETKSAILRLINHLEGQGATMILTELLPDYAEDQSTMNISSIVDTWIRLRLVENNGEFARLIHIAKSRGIKGSNQVREFHIASGGLGIEMPYIGSGEMVVGTARIMREHEESCQKRYAERQLENLRQQVAIKEKMTSLRREMKDAEDAQDIARLKQEIESLENQRASQLESREFVLKERLND
jgi:circadian clock protein KaiC